MSDRIKSGLARARKQTVAEPLEPRRLLAAVGPDAFGYRAETQLLQETDLVAGAAGVEALGTLTGKDDAVERIDLGDNRFNFYGIEYTGQQLFVSTNGLITFDYANPAFGNIHLGSGAMEYAAIAPLWDDWAATGQGQVLYQFEPNELEADKLVIEWSSMGRVPAAPSPVTFQAVLNLNTGSQAGGITFNYFDLDSGDTNADGASATAGIKAAGLMPWSYLMIPYGSDGGFVVEGQSVRIDTGVAASAVDDAAATTQDVPVSGNVLANDVGAEGNDSLHAALGTPPQFGTLNLASDGGYTYTPATGFAGFDSFTYELTDGLEGFGVAVVTIDVAPAAAGSVYLVTDAASPDHTALVVNGTADGDAISLVRASDGVEVFFSCNSAGVFQPTGRIVVYGYGGADGVYLRNSVYQSAWVYGDGGNDLVVLGNGGGIAFGGDGTDLLVGGSGRDLLVGGDGGDVIVGQSGDDILVSALTAYDDRFSSATHGQAWAAIQAEWASSRSFAERVHNLRDGGPGTRLNGSYLLNDTTLIDDADNNRFDLLFGGSGNDWYVSRPGEDLVIGLSRTENQQHEEVI